MTAEPALDLDSPLAALLGARAAKPFASSLGLETVDDLLWHLPRRFAKRGELTALDELPVGEHVSIVAEVTRATTRQMQSRRGSLLEATITDGRGIVSLTFFNQAWRREELVPGARGIFSGKVGLYRGMATLAHPDYEIFEDIQLVAGSPSAKRWAQTPIPIYPASQQVTTWKIHEAVKALFDAGLEIPDPVPAPLRRRRRELDLDTAFRRMHLPASFVDLDLARESVRSTEAFVFQAALLQQRAAARRTPALARPLAVGGFRDRLDGRLEFALTGDQRRAGETIEVELGGVVPMQRLIQGEVGSGKTLVAVRAMLQVTDGGGQSALLAPTEVLAGQHFRSIVEQLGPELESELMPTLLTGSMGQAARRKALLRIASGDARIVIGTHALLGDKVQFADLGLVVVDEQHRFGVEQREALRRRSGTPPHLLVLTATPIPRTVAMTVFGDLDVSTIAELPGGRQGIDSYVVATADRPRWLQRAWERVAEEVRAGRQAFVVCSAIEQSERESGDDLERVGVAPADEGDAPRPPALAVDTVLPMLRGMPVLGGMRIEAVHGRLPGEEKDAVMRAFAEGGIDVLVATTVIEVGVNVPNATVMIVLDADRFGVSQLHQLRGRVGRGAHAGLCLLVTSAAEDTPARERVEAVASTLDGFALAEADLMLRREGDVLGSAQSGGRSSLRILRVVDDAERIIEAREEAAHVVDADPELEGHPALRAAIRRVDSREREFLGAS